MDEILASIDIGTAKVAVVIAENTAEGLVVRGFGIAPVEGVVRGTVVNIHKAEQGVISALKIAEKQAQLKVKKVSVAFGGYPTKIIKGHGIAPVPKDRGTVSPTDIVRAIEAGKSIALPEDKQVVDYAVADFVVDGNPGVDDPIGMAASKVECDLFLFVADSAAVANLMRVMEELDLEVTDVVASPVGSARAILTEEEKELGAVMIDIGAGTTDVVAYKNRRPTAIFTIPYAGESVTHDLMVGLKLPRKEAEKVKIEHGCAVEQLVPADQKVELPGIGGREPRIVDRSFVAMIMEARLEEIISMAKDSLVQSGIDPTGDDYSAGIVLTGGTSITPHIVDLVEKVVKAPARVGLPGDVMPIPDGMNTPDFHTVWGTLNISFERKRLYEQVEAKKGKIPAFWDRIKRWILRQL